MVTAEQKGTRLMFIKGNWTWQFHLSSDVLESSECGVP